MNDARGVLKSELMARGYEVANDTLSARGELYVIGQADLAAALFEFHPDPERAFEAMYQGAWVAGLPPRFAVMPADMAAADQLDLLEQVRIIPLLFERTEEGVRFCDLSVLDAHLPG